MLYIVFYSPGRVVIGGRCVCDDTVRLFPRLYTRAERETARPPQVADGSVCGSLAKAVRTGGSGGRARRFLDRVVTN